MSKQVARVAVRGLVLREDVEEDRRGAYVVLTPKGRRALAQVRTWAAIDQSVLRRLDDLDQERPEESA